MKTLDEVIEWIEDPRMAYCVYKDDALHYLQAYKQLSEGLISDNTIMREDGIYCKVCGTRLDKDWDDENIG